MPVSFWYSGASVFTKKSAKPLMKELSCTTVMALACAPAERGSKVDPAAARDTVMKSRREFMASSVRCEWPEGTARCRHLSSPRPMLRSLSMTPPHRRFFDEIEIGEEYESPG